MSIRYILLGLLTGVVLVYVNLSVWQYERLQAEGQVVYLELAPVDPRSLFQGDFMRLRYAIADELPRAEEPTSGLLVVELDQRNVGTFARLHQTDIPIADDEQLLRYQSQAFDVNIGPQTFFFQEGTAEVYQEATFAELRVSAQGDIVLVGLRDENLVELKPETTP